MGTHDSANPRRRIREAESASAAFS